MPGACWWVEGPDGVLDRGCVGRAAVLPEPVELSESTPYDLASLTKPLAAALAAVLLEQEGLLDLSAPARRYLPELGGGPYADVSVSDLATHRAGFPAWRPLYLECHDLASYLETIAAIPRAVADGETLYSDLGYVLLGAIVERVDGEPLHRVFDRRVATPVGLKRIGYAAEERRFDDAAPTEHGNLYEREMAGAAGAGFRWRAEVLRGEVHDVNAWRLGGVAGHAGLFGTAEEVAAIARELLKPRRLNLSPGNRRRMLGPPAGAGGRTFGLERAAGSAAAQRALPDDAPGHTGFSGTSLWLEPERGRVYVLLTNRVHPAVQLRGIQPVRNEFHRLASLL